VKNEKEKYVIEGGIVAVEAGGAAFWVDLNGNE